MLNLNIEKREQLKKRAKNLYQKEKIPGVLYGPGVKPVPVSVDARDFEKVYDEAGESMLISLKMKDGDKENIVLIRNPQRDVVSRSFIHIDFYQLPLDKPVEVSIQIEAIGESPAVKEQNGVLIKNIQEIAIKTRPQNLIQEIEVDISKLATFDDTITIKDLNLPEGIEVIDQEEDSVVFSVQPPKTQEEIDKEEAENTVTEGEAIAEIKAEGEEDEKEEVEKKDDNVDKQPPETQDSSKEQ